MRRVAEACARMRWVVVGVWLAATVGLTVLAGAVGGESEDDYSLPGSESERASAILRDGGFSFGGGTQAQLVLQRDGGLDDPDSRALVDDLVAQVEAAAPEARVRSPFADDASDQVSEDGEIAFVAVDLPEQDADDLAALAEELDDIRESFSGETVRVELGGLALEQEAESGPPSELVGVLAAVVILLFAFGSVFATGLPILVGVMGAASGVAGVGLAARWVEMPTFAAPVAAMIAIGVGIDYALLVVTRYREALSTGLATTDAIVVAQTTAGRSVLFAGITVVIASLGLVLMDLELITGVALGIAGSVLITMLAAVTLLPALLAVVGHRIDRFSVRRRAAGSDGGPARRWSRQVQKRPLPWAVAATAVLVLLSIPALDMRLGFSDAGTRPTTDTSRRAYDLIAEGFGPGTNGPLVVAARGDGAGSAEAYAGLADALGQTEGVARVSPPVVSEDGSVALVQVVPETGPRDAGTTDLVHRLRDQVVPAVADESLSDVAVGGSTAAAVDFADYNAERLPIFLAVVLGLALLLLMAVFRGFPVAVKAVVVNLLSIGASFGATVAVFQWGWGVDLLDLGAAGPFEAWAPMMLIAIVFGLSMDYEVFLLSRIREEYERTGDNADAVAEGLAQTARVITAAAAIMVCVFGSFVLGSSRELQLFGFGLAAAVLIDATVVRMVLVPSVMELLGDRNWWLPRWLDGTLPHVRIETPEKEPVDA